MSVRGIDRQPILDSVGATFGVRAFTSPVFILHEVEQLRGGGSSTAKRIQSGSNVSVVVIQARCKGVLIVALDQRMFFYLPVFYLLFRHNALSHSPAGPRHVCFTRKLLRSIAPRQADPALFHPCSDVIRSRIESIRLTFLLRPPNPGSKCSISAWIGGCLLLDYCKSAPPSNLGMQLAE